MRFRDRRDAGRQLAAAVAGLRLESPIVLALPRGGVPVAFEVAMRLGAELDVVVARKVGAPGHREFGIGAIAEGGAIIADQDALRMLGIDEPRFAALAAAERTELDRRVTAYRGSRALPELDERDVVLVDDGLATGVTAHAAALGLRPRARRLVLAVPVAAPDAVARLAAMTDDVVVVRQPHDLRSVGEWYHDFTQTSDEEVGDLLARASEAFRSGPS